jgi:hypothetical protein
MRVAPDGGCSSARRAAAEDFVMHVRFERYGRSRRWLLLAGLLGACAAAGVAHAETAAVARSYGLQRVEPARFNGDVRQLPQVTGPQRTHQWNEWEEPESRHPQVPPTPEQGNVALAPMPSPLQNFEGLAFTTGVTGGAAGAGWPPDVNGDVGPNHYIESVNDAFGIYNKTGTFVAGFTENSLWSGAGTGTPCDNSNFGDPVVVHDAVADRWILSNFAFHVNGSGTPVSPFYECIAVSQSSDPVSGGWFLYAVRMDPGGTGLPPVGTLGDYPKFGIWTDCLYMSSNEFTFPAGTFAGAAFLSFSRTALYSGAALTSSNSALGFISSSVDPFTMIPSNLNGTSAGSLPPAGTPNYYVSESQTAFAFEVRKFTAGAGCGAGGTMSAPVNVSQTSYTTPSQNIVPQPAPATSSNLLDSLGDRMMQKVQYRKIGSVESLWVVHTVRSSASSSTRPQWAQINVSGGTVSTVPVQQQIYAPDTTLWRWMGSLAVDALGDMALGYSTSNATSPNFPSIAYSGRLAADPLNNLPQTEVQLMAGSGSQVNTCGGQPCHRWGDYSSMSIDPADDCTFWYINEYYDTQANGNTGHWHTRIGSFKFPTCSGSVVTHTVTPSVGTPSGTISPSTPQTVNDGQTIAFTLTPATGFVIANVTGTCGGTLAGSTYTTNPVTADCTVIANFAAAPPIASITPNPMTFTLNAGATTSSPLHIANTGGGSLTWSIAEAPAACASPSDVPWLSENPTSGSVSGGSSQDSSVTVDATSLAPGGYSAELCVTTNDTTHVLVAVPVNVTVNAVFVPPTLAKAFAPATVQVNVPSTVTLTLANPNASAITLTASLGDTLPSGLLVASPPNASTTCTGGTVNANAGATAFSLASGAGIPANGSCTVVVDVVAATAAVYTNTIPAGALQTNAGSNASPASATLTVTTAPVPPTLAKAFIPSTVPVNTPSTVTLTLSNANALQTVLAVDLRDTLPPGLVVATPANPATTCIAGLVGATSGADSFVLSSGAVIPASGSCTVTVDVVAAADSTYINTIPAGALVTDTGSNASPASATLTVTPIQNNDRIFCDGFDGVACAPLHVDGIASARGGGLGAAPWRTGTELAIDE